MRAERKPEWLRVRLGGGSNYQRVSGIIRARKLHTVCEEALCPNRGRCWEQGRATVMILGDTCTRSCKFCGVTSGTPVDYDEGEPCRVAEAVDAMGLEDIVVTSVTRDDLEDGGAAIWRETILAIRNCMSGVRVEALVPDFGGSAEALDVVMGADPDILGHNLETVPSIYGRARPGADYERSLEILARGHGAGMITKSSIMVGLGETEHEVYAVMADAVRAGCDIFYIGQYLRPSPRHLPVERYVVPSEFESYSKRGLAMGFKVVMSGPLVRSSYYSEEQDSYLRNTPARDRQ